MREYASIIYEAFVYHFEMAETVEASAFCFTEKSNSQHRNSRKIFCNFKKNE